MATGDITPNAPMRPDAGRVSTGTHGGRRRIRRKLDLTSDRAAPEPRSDPADLLVVFYDGHGIRADSYDFASLSLPTDISAVFADAAKAFLTHLTPKTRKSYWNSYRNFSRFVLAAHPPINSVRDVNSDTYQRYRTWLLQQTHCRTGRSLAQRTIANHLHSLGQIFSAAKLLPGNRLPCEIALPAHIMPNRTPTPPQRHLDEPQLKILLSECYYEIEEARRRFQLGRAMLVAPVPPPGQDPKLHHIVHAIATLLADSYPSHKRIISERVSLRLVGKQGGIRRLLSYVCATTDTLTPIYIALLVQLAGNPEPVLNISRECVRPHPLEDHLKILEWEKPRAGRIHRHIQRRAFDSRKRQSAPNLVTLALALTDPLLWRADSRHRSRLFLVPHKDKQCIAPLTTKTLALSIPRFLHRANCRIEEWNRSHPDRPKRHIEPFTPRQLRPSAAHAHHHASGGDIRKTQSILNHASANTTIRYVESRSTQKLRNQVISTLQDTLVNRVLNAESTSTSTETQPAPQALAPRLRIHRPSLPRPSPPSRSRRFSRTSETLPQFPSMHALPASHCSH